MIENHYFIGSRRYGIMSPLTEELSFLDSDKTLFNLDYMGAIKISGINAREFLQGQLTCDVNLVNETTMQRGALCNLKGRILALVEVVLWNSDFYLLLPNDLLIQTIASLSMVAQISRVSLDHIPSIKINGVLNAENLPVNPGEVLNSDASCCYCLTANRHIYISHDPLTLDLAQKGSLAWHFLQLQDQNLEIYPETRALFLPHRLNLHNTGFINFNKGTPLSI